MAEITTETLQKPSEKEGKQDVLLPPLASKKQVDEAAERIRAERELPKRPGNKVSFNDMRNWLALLRPDQEERVNVYIYRHKPYSVRQRSSPDNPNNIDAIYDGFKNLNEQYMIETHGGGKYGFIIKDLDYAKGKDKPGNDKGYFEATLDIPMSQYPPKMDLREVVWEDNSNAGFLSWARAQGLIDMNNQPVDKTKIGQQQVNGAASNDQIVQVMNTMVSMFEKLQPKDQQNVKKQLGGEEGLTKSIGEILLEKMKQEDPNKQLATFTAMITAMNATKQPAPSSGLAEFMPMFQMMFQSAQETNKQMMQTQAENTKVLIELIKANNSDGEDKGDEFTKLKSLLEIAREIKGGGGGGSEKSTTEVIVEKIADIAGPVINGVVAILQLNAAQKTGVGAVPQGQPQTPTQQQLLAQAAQQAQQQVQAQQQQQSQAQPQQSNVMPINTNTGTTGNSLNGVPVELIQSMAQFAPLVFNNMGSKEGYELPEMIINWYPGGDAIVASIVRYGPDNILNAMKQVPDLWKQIMATYGEDHAKQWVQDFCDYKAILAELEEDEKDEEEKGGKKSS